MAAHCGMLWYLFTKVYSFMDVIAQNLHGFVVFLAGRDGVMIMPGFHIPRTDMKRFAAGAIIIPASHVSGQETFPPKELPHYASPAALSCAPKGRRSMRHIAPEAS